MKSKVLVFHFSAFFLAAGIVNDLVLVESISLTFAKVSVMLSLAFGLIAGYKLRPLKIYELILSLFVFGLILISIFFSSTVLTTNSISVTVSLNIGLLIVVFMSRLFTSPYLIIKYFNYWIFLSVSLAFIQAVSGSLFFLGRVFESTLIPNLYRGVGFMSDPNYFALVCLIGVVSLYLYYKKINWLLLIPIAGVVLSGSRSGLIILFFTLFLLNYKGKISFVFLFKVINLLLLFLFTLYSLSSYLPASIGMIFDISSYGDSSRNSLSDRFVAIMAGWEAFLSNPLWGYGIGNLVNHPSNYHGQVSHNTLIELLAEVGLVGLSLYVILNLYIIRKTLSILKKSFLERIEAKSIFLMLIVFNLMSLSVVTYYSRILFFVILLCFLFFGLSKLEAVNTRRV